jgi:hypothetical protein
VHRSTSAEYRVFMAMVVLFAILVLNQSAVVSGKEIVSVLQNNAISIDAQFPVSFWVGPPNAHLDLDTVNDIKAAGFTHCMPFYSMNGIFNTNRVIEYTDQVEIPYVASDSRLHHGGFGDIELLEQILDIHGEKIANDYKGLVGVIGVVVADEPSVSKFEVVARLTSFVKENLAGVLPYVNLYPNYATRQQLGVDTYEQYVDTYIRVVNPMFISFDFYPFTGKQGSIKTGFYSNLEIIRQKALEYNLPFWTFVQSCRFGSMRNPTPEEIRWQVYHNLGYGAKGIQYFVYWSLGPGNREGITDGIVQWDGTKTEHYDTVTQINSELQKIGTTLLTLTSEGVHFSASFPQELKELTVNYKPEWLYGMTGGDVLAGIFSSSNGDKYMLIVNNSLSKKTAINVSIDTAFTSVMQMNKTTGELHKVHTKSDLTSTMFQLELSAGDGELFRLVGVQ